MAATSFTLEESVVSASADSGSVVVTTSNVDVMENVGTGVASYSSISVGPLRHGHGLTAGTIVQANALGNVAANAVSRLSPPRGGNRGKEVFMTAQMEVAV